jgi:hypothetical protein
MPLARDGSNNKAPERIYEIWIDGMKQMNDHDPRLMDD